MFVPIVEATATLGDQLIGGGPADGHPGQPPVPAGGGAGRRPHRRAPPAAARLVAGRRQLVGPNALIGAPAAGQARGRLPCSASGAGTPAFDDRHGLGRARGRDRRARSKSLGDLLAREHLDDRAALVGGADEEEAAGPDQGEGRHADGPLHVGDGQPAVGAVDDHRQALAAAEAGRDVAQLDGGADGGHVRGDRHEDAVRLVEDRLVERAVRRVEVDDDDVDLRAGRADRGGHPGRVEDVGVERRVGQRRRPGGRSCGPPRCRRAPRSVRPRPRRASCRRRSAPRRCRARS